MDDPQRVSSNSSDKLGAMLKRNENRRFSMQATVKKESSTEIKTDDDTMAWR